MIDKSILERERKRWEESLTKAYTDIHFENLINKNLDEKQYNKIAQDIQTAHLLVFRMVNAAFDEAPRLFDKVEDISIWERYLTSIRVLFLKVPESILFKFGLPLLGLGELRKGILDWINTSIGSLPYFYSLMKESEKYFTNYNKGVEISGREERYLKELVPLYASLKTWGTEERFEDFCHTLTFLTNNLVTIYIEGPVQLYLSFSKNHFILILKTLLLENLNHSVDNRIIKDFELLNARIETVLESSKTLDFTTKLLNKTSEKAITDWITEQKIRRQLQPTPYLKEKFVRNFESGVFITVHG